MITLPKRQTELIRRTQTDQFIVTAEAFLRHHFEFRLQHCSSEDIRQAASSARIIGREHDITHRGEILIYLACSCVCGMFIFDDPRCLWLFQERPTAQATEIESNFNIDTFSQNLDASITLGFFEENPIIHFEDSIKDAERLLELGAGIKRALLTMTPTREAFIETHRFGHFVDVARRMGQQQRLEGHRLVRYVLLAWLFGVRFIDDPLCRKIVTFLTRVSPLCGHLTLGFAA